MRKIVVTALLTLFACIALAQTSSEGTLKFLGIPVDGTKDEMISRLKAKDFRYNSYDDLLYGQFNGKDAEIHVGTNHGVVDRVVVVFPSIPESQIISEYNALLSQFNNNDKYIGIGENERIASDENLSYEIAIHHKDYEADFAYISPDLFSEEEASQIRSLLSQAKNMDKEEMQALLASMAPNEEGEMSVEQGMLILNKMMSFVSSHVWFAILEDGSKYCICLYYDNLKNRPHGEDL